jgi:DNA modification methylase
MRTYIHQKKKNSLDLPEKFQDDDMRYSESLVEYFLNEFTKINDIVFDPFSGYGTTLFVTEKMERKPIGIEIEEDKVKYIRTVLNDPDGIRLGDSRVLNSYSLPTIDFSMTSPPYMVKNGVTDPFTAYTIKGDGYLGYLRDIRKIYENINTLLKTDAKVVIEVSNIKKNDEVTTLAWDIAKEVSNVLHFKGEIVVNWDEYGSGYDHSYCLIFSKK